MKRTALLAAGNDFNFVTNVDILSDKDITIVVELMGRIGPAKTFITRALGDTLLLLTRTFLAVHGVELLEIAKEA